MKVWGIKARLIKACIISNKRSGLQTICMWLHAWTYLNNYSTISNGSWLWLHLFKICLLHNVAENITKKSTETKKKTQKRDVGMACQEVHK